jgi:hypothetical protein
MSITLDRFPVKKARTCRINIPFLRKRTTWYRLRYDHPETSNASGPDPGMNGVLSLPATAYSFWFFKINKDEKITAIRIPLYGLAVLGNAGQGAGQAYATAAFHGRA